MQEHLSKVNLSSQEFFFFNFCIPYQRNIISSDSPLPSARYPRIDFFCFSLVDVCINVFGVHSR